MNIIFSALAWKQYTQWQSEDMGVTKKINSLIQSVTRDGLAKGEGQPEVLKHIKAFSRRISYEDRLVYACDEKKNIVIISCKGHYEA